MPDLALFQSRQRSIQFGVDSHRASLAILEASEFKRQLECNKPVLQEIYPVFERLARWIRCSRSIVIAADRTGHILDSQGDPGFLKDAEKIHLKKAACWSEEVRGTNAIGTAIAELKAVSVIGDEHYLSDNHVLWCAASPIFDPQGRLLAVLDISGHRDEYQPFSLMMVDTLTRQIEDRLLLQNSDHQLIVSLVNQHGQTNCPLVAMNEDGCITGLNREARFLFRIEQLPKDPPHISKYLSDYQSLLMNLKQNRKHPVRLTDTRDRLTAAVLVDSRTNKWSFNHPVHSQTKRVRSDLSAHSTVYSFSDIFCEDVSFSRMLELAKRAALTDYTILIHGESGTGKEMISQAIHNVSPRSDKPFVAINCGAVPKHLLESELFGYESGAFTGAKQSGQIGKFELAEGGTLFLDEVAEMPLEMQVVLLRVLQERTVMRIGGTRLIPIDVRIIAATHKNLWNEVQEGRFRADLFYRLQGIHLEIPPLRERTDRLPFALYLLKQIECELYSSPLLLHPESQKIITQYTWPGNTRELAAALRHASFLAAGETILPEHFPAYIQSDKPTVPSSFSMGDDTLSLDKIEYSAIVNALEKTNGNISQAAKLLGIGRNTLYRRLRSKQPKE
ncbi:sigma-54-dependent Fis family transcriptional regulator [Effusibacillus dendaii]|uniref:Sigma-54-dependent Fis family transcriptional regulator n=1 Tax=Effusibacillus dendaii TaxID=2743772 RepID=A0A7I8DAK1_9BACL|nr:sigma-54-dependent Fis family transcriptional regulator [Effusibacillus dendaii]BCJ87125.1 sigma-54-dependent Fis family transcriptional regulator [Effusibacillus dendaii]